MKGRALIFLGGAELPWIYPLGVELARLMPTLLLRVGASWSLRRPAVSWPFDDHPPGLMTEAWTYPPGFNGRLGPLFTTLVRARVRAARQMMAKRFGARASVVISDPKFEKYSRDLEEDSCIYLNYDDYSTHGPGSRAESPFERQLVQRSGTVFCASQYQCQAFKERFSDKVGSVFHLPHGVHDSFVNPSPTEVSTRTVATVGSLTARYSWKLIGEVVDRLPDVRFVFAGEVVRGNIGGRDERWEERMVGVLGRPNVTQTTGLRHRDTASIYWSASLNWMPYEPGLPFVNACCPLKLTDGLASGRPIVSADIPESRLYPEWIRIYRGVDEAVAHISDVMNTSNTDEARRLSEAQLRFARENTWAARARLFADTLERA